MEKNNKPTFQEQYNKITTAYFKNELNPLETCACFIGNLLNNKREWSGGRICESEYKTYSLVPNDVADLCIKEESNNFYTKNELYDLEMLFLQSIGSGYFEVNRNRMNEDILFHAMEVTLEALRKLHEEKGEVVEDYIFSKRELQIV